jgi:glycosyltransferase involved in cell wall biosynthesis
LDKSLRVAFIAGSLTQGGAEKQFIYMVRELLDRGVDVRIFSLTQGEYYEPTIKKMGLLPIWLGRCSSPLLRIIFLITGLNKFQPHIIQSTHFFTNLYAAITGRLVGSISIGSIRNDIFHSLNVHGFWGSWLLRSPSALLANSYSAKQGVEGVGLSPEKISVLPNVIDLADYGSHVTHIELPPTLTGNVLFFVVARMVRAKRLDRFLAALAIARRTHENIMGVLVGDGPQRLNLENIAKNLNLTPNGVIFLGRRDDVPSLLHQADALVITSDYEGFPNVLIEAMASRIPVITTPAGDADSIIQDGVTGFVVPFDGVEGIAKRMVQLANSPDLRERLGRAGRRVVETRFSFEQQKNRLLSTYRSIAWQQENPRVMDLIAHHMLY